MGRGEAHLFWGCPQGGLCPQTCAVEYSDRCSRVSTYRLHDIQHRLTDGCSKGPAVRLPLAASMSFSISRSVRYSRGRLDRRTSRRRAASTVTFSAVGASSAACRLSMKIPLSAIQLLQIMPELPQLVERKKLLHSTSCYRIATTDRRRFHCSTRQLCYDLTRNR